MGGMLHLEWTQMHACELTILTWSGCSADIMSRAHTWEAELTFCQGTW